jgi:hypothetical protein
VYNSGYLQISLIAGRCFVISSRREVKEMKRSISWVLCLGIVFLLPHLSSAECTNIGGFSNFSLEGTNTVILYAGPSPVLRFDVLNCSVQPTSKIELIKNDVCDGDEIMIDGSRCTMMEIKPLGP